MHQDGKLADLLLLVSRMQPEDEERNRVLPTKRIPQQTDSNLDAKSSSERSPLQSKRLPKPVWLKQRFVKQPLNNKDGLPSDFISKESRNFSRLNSALKS